ncbi:MAG: phosphatase PAP2 family protein [Phycisphaerales bacterium]
MTYLNPHPGPGSARRRRLARAALGWTVILIIAHLLDRWAFQQAYVADAAARSVIESKDWYRFLRIMGYLPTWLILGIALLLAGRGGNERATPGTLGRRESPETMGILIPVAAGLSGLLAELLKIIVRRGRPIDYDGDYGWIAFSDGFVQTSRLGMASSHAAVAFGAAFTVMRVHPRSGWVLVPLAAGCGYTRMLSGQHFLSDIVGAAAIGWLVAWILTPATGTRSR